MSKQEKNLLRDLAKRYLECCQDGRQEERRELWRDHNSLIKTRPLIYVRAFAWGEMPESVCLCEDPFLRQYENHFRHHIFWHSLNDDSIFNPWLTVRATFKQSGWGIDIKRNRTADPRGSYKTEYPLQDLSDMERLVVPEHAIDESATAEKLARMEDVLGDILPVTLDRAPCYTVWSADLSTDLGQLRGIENIMMDMYDNPEWLHSLLAFMSGGVEKAQMEAEEAGDWNLCAHQNQAMPYSRELPDPAPGRSAVKRSDLWCFMAAQEYTGISPAMHDEFLLRYQLPILQKFGLVAYGCCEDLSRKIDMLRQIPNLRRIAVAPCADVATCAGQIGQDYVLSYRPNPVDMVGYDFNPTRIRKDLTRDLSFCRDSHVDITLKDVETVENDPHRVREWVNITRGVIERCF